MTRVVPNPDPLTPRLTVPWWLVGALAVSFVALGLICRGGTTLGLDLDVSHWVQDRSPTWADAIAAVGNTIGEAPVAIGLLVIALTPGIVLKRWREVWFLLVVAVGRLVGTFLKGLFESSRPISDEVHLLGVFDGYGFPSGHTMTSTLAAGTLAFLIARQTPLRSIHLLLAACWAVAVALTAFARIWVGAHWFTDTIGGALYGIMVVMLAANLSVLLVQRWPGIESSRADDRM